MHRERPDLCPAEGPRDGTDAGAFRWRRVLTRLVPYLVVTLAANSAIAGLLTVALPPPHNAFFPNFVYSQFIGLPIMLLVALPRLTCWPRESVAPWQASIHLAFATVVGFVAGSYAASLVLGTAPLIRTREPGDNLLLMAALLTVMASVGCSSFFWLRERVAALRLEASAERTRAQAERTRAEAASRQATEAQLNMVRAQLEPHMLFNTLANLRSLMTVDPPRAQLMVDHLISFLRATLAASRRDEVTLREEFDLLHDYLELISIRMGKRLSFTLDLPAELVATPVMPLLLQPLVENAVRHGIEPAIDGGRIDVLASVVEGQLTLVVGDTGVGFAPAGIGIGANECPKCSAHGGTDDETGRSEVAAGGWGFGLAQVLERLKTAYGDAGRMTIESPRLHGFEGIGGLPGDSVAGTRVTLMFPAPPGRSPWKPLR